MFIRMMNRDYKEVWVNKRHIISFEPTTNGELNETYWFVRVYSGSGLCNCYYVKKNDVEALLKQDDEELELIKNLMEKGGPA